MKTGPLSAVKQYCYWCCGDDHNEATLCPAVECPIHSIRKGRKPVEFNKTALKAIKERCLDCSGYEYKGVRECGHKDCALYVFRLGKNPNRRLSTYQTINQRDPIPSSTVSTGDSTIESHEQGGTEEVRMSQTTENGKEALR